MTDRLPAPAEHEELTTLRARVGELEARLAPLPLQPEPDPPRRSLKWAAWRVVRPVVRPAAWRLRTFLVGPVRDEVVDLRAEVADMRRRLEQIATEATGPALDRRVLAVMEQALLTIALDREDK